MKDRTDFPNGKSLQLDDDMKMLKEKEKKQQKITSTVFEGYGTIRTGTCITARKNIMKKAS